MNDVQFFTAIAVAPCMTVAAVILAAIIGNSRLTDVKEVLRAEFRTDIQRLEHQIEKLDAKMDEHLRVVLGKIEDVEKRR